MRERRLAIEICAGAAFLSSAAFGCSNGSDTGVGGTSSATSGTSQSTNGNTVGSGTSSTTTSAGTMSSGATSSTGSMGTASSSSGAGGLCPAPAPTGNSMVVYGEGVAPEWACYGFSSQAAPQSTTVCSGNEAMGYSAHQYDGFQFQTDTAPVTANHLSVRVHVDQASDWTIAAVKPGETDPHQFLGSPAVMNWKAGWQDVELDIPPTTPQTRWILFEHQSAGQVVLTVDDLRLVTQ